MVAGQLDASAIQLSDIPSLEDLAPGKFHDIYDIAKKWPFIMDAVIFVRTSMLQQNRPLVKTVLEQILKEQRQAPSKGGRRLNLLYGAQVESRPPRFRLTVNDPGLVTRDYGYWVENQLRERFELEGVPVVVDFRKRS